MTLTVGYSFQYKGKDLYLVAQSSHLLFSLGSYGINPKESAVAQRVYNITEDGLFLEELGIISEKNECPSINGIYPDSDNHYKGIHGKTHYTGKLLLGDDLLCDYHIPFRYPWPWVFKTLKEFVFERGKLVEINDQSNMAAHLRKIMGRDKDFLPYLEDQFTNHLGECFSLDYTVKAWWLPEGDFDLFNTGGDLTFFLHNNRDFFGNNLLRDLITSIEHPDVPFIDTVVNPEIIHQILKRRKLNFSEIKHITLNIGLDPVGNIDGLLEFFEEVHKNTDAKITISASDPDSLFEARPPLEKFVGKIDALEFSILPQNVDDDTCSSKYEAIFGDDKYESFSTSIPELKKYIPEIVIKASTRKLNKETIEECRRIIEDELQVNFKSW